MLPNAVNKMGKGREEMDLELSAIEVISATSKLLIIHSFAHVHLTRVDLEDSRTRLLSRMWELNLTI